MDLPQDSKPTFARRRIQGAAGEIDGGIACSIRSRQDSAHALACADAHSQPARD